jgi:CheY-like chemotaxis protein
MDGLNATNIIRAAETGASISIDLPDKVRTLLARKLRGKYLPVVAMTAHAMEGDREMCLAAGMDAYITKPLQPGHLVEVLMAVLTDYPLAAEKQTEPMEHSAAPSPQTLPPQPTAEAVWACLQTTTLLAPAQIDKLLQTARMSVIANLNAADAALHNQDYPTLIRAAHTLKGTLLQCGLADWAERAQQIHDGAKDQREMPLAEMLAAIRQGMRQLLTIQE